MNEFDNSIEDSNVDEKPSTSGYSTTSATAQRMPELVTFTDGVTR